MKAVRESDSKGRHTTNRRELIRLPTGGLIIDTPGMRELQLWGEEESLEESFEDLEAIAAQCRFSDCQHQHEPGCAIRQASSTGEVDPGRVESYLKLKRELQALKKRQERKARLAAQARGKKIHKRENRKRERKGSKMQLRREEDL